MRAAILGLLLWAHAASAGEAERTRLQRELHDQAARSAWEGVERTYRSLIQLGLPLAPADHLVGHQAALRRGDPLLAAMRLGRASATGAPDEVHRARTALLESHGLVAIVVKPPHRRTLERADTTFSPHEQAAVARAAEILRATGELRMLLPVGGYTIAGRFFRVEPGTRWQTLVVTDD